MNFTEEQREQAYEASSEVQKYLYEGQRSGQALYDIGKNRGLVDVEVRMQFLIGVGDVILGLVPQSQLPQLLIERLGLTQADAMRLTADVLDFLAPLSDSGVAVATRIPINQPMTATEPASLETVVASEQNQPPTPESVDSLAAEIAATEASFHQLQPIRTMASDMNSLRSTEEPVHQGVSQNTLLNGDGNGKKNPDARWGNG